jgi:transcriptional regulator with XRE-family HTH domain
MQLIGRGPKSYSDHPVTLGDFLKIKRIELRLTQNQVSDEIGVTSHTVRNWEANRGEVQLQFRKKVYDFIGFCPCDVSLSLILRLKERREYMGISSKQIAIRFGVNTHSVTNWELGKHKPSAENIKKIELFLKQSKT